MGRAPPPPLNDYFNIYICSLAIVFFFDYLFILFHVLIWVLSKFGMVSWRRCSNSILSST